MLLRDVLDLLAAVGLRLHLPGKHGHFGLGLGFLPFLCGLGFAACDGGAELAAVGAVFLAGGLCRFLTGFFTKFRELLLIDRTLRLVERWRPVFKGDIGLSPACDG